MGTTLVGTALQAPPTSSSGPTETVVEAFTRLLAGVVGRDDVSPEAHFFTDLGADSMLMARFCARVRKDPDLPSVSMKDVYANPTLRQLGEAVAPPAAGGSELEGHLATVLAKVVGRDDVSPEAHFFTDLGADSMLMARFCARVRKDPDLPSVSMKEVYANPTIRELAAAVGGPAAEVVTAPSPIESSVPPVRYPTQAPSWQFYLCGLFQTLIYLGYTALAATTGLYGYRWITQSASIWDIYQRCVLVAVGVFVVMSLLPLVAKWLLIGRWKPARFPVWSPAYMKFWLVKTLLRTSPLALFVGSPLVVAYLRLMGAKVGRDVTIMARGLPVCTDLLTIGDGTVIRKDALVSGYRAHAGMIEIGSVSLGSRVIVGEASVLDIDTVMEDDTQLGHRSSLHAGQTIPAGQVWHGSPAVPSQADYRVLPDLPVSRRRRFWFPTLQLANRILVAFPVVMLVALAVLSIERAAGLLDAHPVALGSWGFYVDALIFASVVMVVGLVLAMFMVTTVPRLLNLVMRPDTVYPLFGWRYAIHRTIMRMTNSKFLLEIVGDSSYVVGYLQAIGWKLPQVQQTGSNFGAETRHESPYLSTVGTGTMVADGLSVSNADYTATAFRVSETRIGAHSFLGNHILYPVGARTGDNCLLATKVMVPTDGPLRENTGLLGSPPFEIPRSVERDGTFDDDHAPERFGPLLRAKNRHNLVTIGLLFLVRWATMLIATVVMMIGLEFSDSLGMISLTLAMFVGMIAALLFVIGVDRIVVLFHPMGERFCSIYDPYFWMHERYWKLQLNPRLINIFNGTPFRPLIWRMLGVRIGRRVFDDGVGIPERPLVSIGSYATLNAGCYIQCHSQEDGAFKSDFTSVGEGYTEGVGVLIHYGVTVGDGAVVATDSFLMKGEDVPPYALWGGNPAREIRATPTPQPLPPGRHRAKRRPTPLTVVRPPAAALEDRPVSLSRPGTAPELPNVFLPPSPDRHMMPSDQPVKLPARH